MTSQSHRNSQRSGSTLPHILFLMSDTGGGHRAASRAIEAALQRRHPDAFTTELVDMWKEYTPFPFNRMHTLYARWVNSHPASYGAQFWLSERLFRSRAISNLYCRSAYGRMRHLYSDHPADVIVCVHSVFVRPTIHALRRLGLRKPFITVVTDYALPPVVWYDPRVDRCLVPTEPAYERGLQLGMMPGQMLLTGAPVHPRFSDLQLSKAEARAQLDWDHHARIGLLVGGGDGMGRLLETAQAIDSALAASGNKQAQLVVIAGRNQELQHQLAQTTWRGKVRVYGFVSNIELMMRAADVMISKAGPASITEAAIMGLPLLLNGAIPYQETVNAEYVVKQGVGLYETEPERVAAAFVGILSDETKLAQMAESISKLAQPEAIWRIADEIWRYVDGSN
ncbi:MAG: glycosyltransferase [Anaerolineae bacterium]|nr:glycosyltransferase [Anaerolineae bacterium]